LASCYTRSLEVAADLGAASVAFPNISTGVFGYPKDRAADVAVDAVAAWTATNDGVDDIWFVVFDEENQWLYSDRLA
jgi:O-acetyl-ADP-ribose deacetylase (regulator of RNase III)